MTQAPLRDFICSLSSEDVERIAADTTRKDSLASAIALVYLRCTGEFVTRTLSSLPYLDKANQDVVASEAAAFFAYALRESFDPVNAKVLREMADMDDEDFDDADLDDDEETQTLKDAASICQAFARKYLGDPADKVFEARLMQYHACPSIIGDACAVEQFEARLATMANAQTPSSIYGQRPTEVQVQVTTAHHVRKFVHDLMPSHLNSMKSLMATLR